jgi:hypothetical protein
MSALTASTKSIYKKVKCIKEFCPKCGGQLSGNNSYVSTWRCSCGVWRAITYPDFQGEYEIEPRAELSKGDCPKTGLAS